MTQRKFFQNGQFAVQNDISQISWLLFQGRIVHYFVGWHESMGRKRKQNAELSSHLVIFGGKGQGWVRCLKGIDVLSLTPRKHTPDPWTRGHLAPFGLERGNGLVGASRRKTQAMFAAHGFCLHPPFPPFKEKRYFHVFYFGAVSHKIFTGHFLKIGHYFRAPEHNSALWKEEQSWKRKHGKGFLCPAHLKSPSHLQV